MDQFDAAVLAAIRHQNAERGGARFPFPVGLWYSGEPTQYARQLGLVAKDNKVVLDAERRVFAAVKRLHAAGELVFARRFGYTWCVQPWNGVLLEADVEVVTGPADVPYYWDEL